jgi:signal transduction histidine kinase
MLFSELLLLAFMGYWLYTQYNSSRSDFQKALIAQFEESQRKVSDSLLLKQLVNINLAPGTSMVETIDVHPKEPLNIDVNTKGNHNFDVVHTQEIRRPGAPVAGETFVLNSANINDTSGHLHFRKDVSVKVVIGKITGFVDSNESFLFTRDTALFNDLFAKKMKENGWSFRLKWTNDSTGAQLNKKRIFIKSDYFTSSYGIEVSHFSWYLLRKISPQVLFTILLLLITGFAFRLAYGGLKEETTLSSIRNGLISNMSHELKTPVSTIKVALEALDTYDVLEDKEKAKEYLAMANLEMKRLDLLINQALNTSLMEEGRFVFHKEKEDLQKLIAEVLSIMKIRFAQQHADVHYNYSGNNFFIKADKLHVQGVLINILDNCLKYAGQDPFIDILVKELEQQVQVTIADKGPGIPAAYLDKIFGKFFRVPSGNEHSVKGYGLGLSYAAQVMQQHDGSIKVSNDPAGGAVFTLTFNKLTT